MTCYETARQKDKYYWSLAMCKQNNTQNRQNKHTYLKKPDAENTDRRLPEGKDVGRNKQDYIQDNRPAKNKMSHKKCVMSGND